MPREPTGVFARDLNHAQAAACARAVPEPVHFDTPLELLGQSLTLHKLRSLGRAGFAPVRQTHNCGGRERL